MSNLALFLVIPALLSWALLALVPAGRPFVTALVCWAILIALFGLAALQEAHRPYRGPDDWFRGIELIAMYLALPGALAAIAAQVWRWLRLRAGRPPHYPIALTVTTALTVFGVYLFLEHRW